MAKISRPILYTALAGIIAVAYVYTQDEPVNARAAKKKSTTASKSSTTKDKLGFTEEDYNPPTFAPVTAGRSNAFQPIVVRTRGAAEVAASPDAVPAELAGGDPNWFYTGNAEIDGKATALLDNRVTMESEFVSVGQKWKRATVVQILPQGLVLASLSGRKVRLTLNNGEATVLPGSSRYASGFQPVNPALRGPIGNGNGVGIRPDRSAERNGNMETRDAN